MPDASKIPPRIIVMRRDDYNDARIERPELFSDPFTRVAPYPPRESDALNVPVQEISKVLQPNSLLLWSELGGNKYVTAATVHEEMAVEKFLAFANVCQRLGATLLEVKELRQISDSGTVVGSAKFDQPSALQVHGEFSGESVRKLAQSIKGRWVWNPGSGGSAGVADVRAARESATQRGIINDTVTRELIEQVEFSANPLDRQELQLNISSEAHRAVKAAIDVSTVFKDLGPGIEASFDALRKHDYEVVLELVIDFRPEAGRASQETKPS